MNKSNKNLIYLITFFAGFSFLIYEVSWNRYLSLILGTTVMASTIVLMAFMSGFGFGALFLGKYANKTRNPGRLLAIKLAGIGLSSLVNFFIIQKVLQTFYGSFSNLLVADIVIFSITFILLFIPAFFMGGIIPLVNKIIIFENKNISKILGTVYAFETLGSTIGGLIAGFILLGTIGQKQTIFVAVSINLIMAVFLFISKKYSTAQTIIQTKKKQKTDTTELKASRKIALISTFAIGFAILGLQIIWIRIFKTYFTNTSYTFALITAFSIFGLSIGSFIYKKRGERIKNNDIVMRQVLLLISLFAIVGLLILLALPELLLFPLKNIIENPYIRLLVVPVIASILIVIPPTIVSGFAFPLACKMYSNGVAKISENVGRVLMFNTIGSVLGPAVATFLLIPLLGAGKSIFVISMFLLLSLGFAPELKSTKRILSITKKSRTWAIVATIGILITFIFLSLLPLSLRFVPPSIKKFDKKILVYEEKIEGTIVIVDEPKKGVFGKSTFINNSSVIGSNYDAIKAVKMVGHIPFFSDLKCENVLIVGFGIGVTTSAIASHKEVKKIDCVELVPGLVKNAHYYHDFNLGVYNDKRLNIIPGDGRHFLQLTSNKYDLISCDPTHPVLGSGNLYTQEYFQQCYDHLNPEGMVSQYLPLHKLRHEDLLGMIKTFHSVFPNSYVFLGQYHAILFGKKGDGKIDFKIWENKVAEVPKDEFFYLEPYHIASCVIFTPEDIENFPKEIKINTDNLSYTEFFSFDCFDSENLYENLKYLSENRCDINKAFSNIDEQMKIDIFVEGNIKLMESLYFSLKAKDKKSEGKLGEAKELNNKAINSLQNACKINPEDLEYPFLIKLYYGKN